MVPLARQDRAQSSRARAADAAANAASPDVSQPIPANRHDPITSVVLGFELGQVSVVTHPHRLRAQERVEPCPDVVTAGLAQPAEGGRVPA